MRRGQEYFVERAFYQRLLHFDRRPRIGQMRLSIAEYLVFLQSWQMASGDKFAGPESLRKVIMQLQGVALSQQHWLDSLASRISDFSERMLEDLFLTGEFFWWRANEADSRIQSITRKTRYMILSRELWSKIAEPAAKPVEAALGADAQRIYQYLKENGASFIADIHHSGKYLSDHTLRGLRELIGKGLVTSDQFFELRLLHPRKRGGVPSRVQFPAGRFSLVRFPTFCDEDARAEAIAQISFACPGLSWSGLSVSWKWEGLFAAVGSLMDFGASNLQSPQRSGASRHWGRTLTCRQLWPRATP
jgi:hypothetical protein